MTDAPDRIWLTTTNSGRVDEFTMWLDDLSHLPPEAPRTAYIRADLHEAQLAALRDRVEALSLALSHIDAMDPEERMIGGVSEHAAKGLLLRMGEVARAALKADQ